VDDQEGPQVVGDQDEAVVIGGHGGNSGAGGPDHPSAAPAPLGPHFLSRAATSASFQSPNGAGGQRITPCTPSPRSVAARIRAERSPSRPRSAAITTYATPSGGRQARRLPVDSSAQAGS